MRAKTSPERCPECGARLARGATICASCGRLVAAREPERCPVCGAQYDLMEEQCPICGAERRGAPAARASSLVGIALGALALVVIVVLGVQLRPWQNATLDPDALVAAAVDRLGPTQAPAADAPSSPTATLAATALPATAAATLTVTSSPTATAEPTATTPSTETPTITPTAITGYIVQAGDTLLKIANRHDLSLDALLAANGLSRDAVLSIGQELQLPETEPTVASPETTVSPSPTATATPPAEAVVHTIAAGDTLLAIARAYGVTVAAITAANDIGTGSILSVGQELVIPGQESEAAPAITSTTAPTLEPTVALTSLPSPTPTAQPEELRHIVAKGDTLGRIAVQYDVAAENIAAANDITTTSVLSIGQELVIPGQTPEATVAPSPTQTVIPSPTATVRALLATAAGETEADHFKYITPELLSPPNNTKLAADEAPLLSWVSVGILEDEEWYRLRIWTAFGKVEPRIVWTKATSWRPDEALRGGGSSEYCWQVQVATRTEDGQADTQLSGLSAKYTFTWR